MVVRVPLESAAVNILLLSKKTNKVRRSNRYSQRRLSGVVVVTPSAHLLFGEAVHFRLLELVEAVARNTSMKNSYLTHG
jgi:predicted transcriptional regulator